MDAQEKRIYTAIIIAVVVFATIIVYFFVSMIRQHRRNIRMQREARMIELNAQENERKRMANDLHDELSPVLTAIKMGINNVQPINDEDAARLEKAHGYIDSLSKRMREISFNLMPAALIRKGLFKALEELASFINKNNKMQVTLFVPPVEKNLLTEEASINIYRIVQEIVHNTLKHANATELKIQVTLENGNLYLCTIDNGVGFDYDGVIKEHSGLGIRSIEGRVDLLAGDIDVQSKPGKGTAFTIQIPLITK